MSQKSVVNSSPQSVPIRCIESSLVSATIESSPYFWSVEELCDWFMHTDFLAPLVPKIKRLGLTGESFMLLTYEDLCHKLELQLGPAQKVLAVIEIMKQKCFISCPVES